MGAGDNTANMSIERHFKKDAEHRRDIGAALAFLFSPTAPPAAVDARAQHATGWQAASASPEVLP